MLKKLLLTLVILFVVLILAVVALVLFVDVNRFKPQIESFVQETYQRDLKINGDLSLSVFPSIAVSLPNMSLSESGGKDTTLSLDSARVSVKLMPLLTGNVEADVVSLAGLKADIIRRPDGSTNIDDLIGGGAGQADQKPADQDSSDSAGGPAISEINIGGVELTDANVSFDDQQAKSKWVVSGLNLETGALSDGVETPVTLKLSASGTNPKVKADIELDSRIALKLATQQVTSPNLTLSIKGAFDGMPIDQTVEVKGLTAGPEQVLAEMITTTSRLDQGARKLSATLKTPFQMNLADGALAMSALTGQIDLNDPAIGPDAISVPLSGTVKANTNAETANVALKLSAKDMNLDAKVDVKGFAQPAIDFDINADRIDVDKFLPPSPAPEKTVAASGGQQAAGAAEPEAPIDLSALKTLNLNGKLTVGELIASGAKLSKLAVTVKAAKGVMTLAPISAQLYEGNLKGTASVNASGNKTAAKLNLSGIQIGPLLTDVADTDLLEGRGDVGVDIRTGGPTVSAMKQALNGKASMALNDGAIKGINLGEKIRQAKNLLKAGKSSTEASNSNVRTDFSALTASFNIVNGIASNDDLAGKTPLLRLSGGGKVDIPASTLDYLAKATVVGTSKGQGGKEISELNGVTIPVQLGGSFDQLTWAIDWNIAAKEFLKSKAAAKLGVDKAELDAKKAKLKADAKEQEDKLRAEAKQREDELKDKAKKKLEDKLKKLF
ncbi:MAG: AsmA family protein [Burkholderiaceae bacterium]